MKFSTYGIFEIARQKLAQTVAKDFDLDIQIVNNALLGPVISHLCESTARLKSELVNANANRSSAEIELQVFEHSLSTILPSLAAELNLPQANLEKNVAEYNSAARDIYNQYSPIIATIMGKAQIAKENALVRFYGDKFLVKNNDLAKDLIFNDKDILEAANKTVAYELSQCTSEVQDVLKQHLVYFSELAAQMPINNDFAAKFEKIKNRTMEQYKGKIFDKRSKMQTEPVLAENESSNPQFTF
jgi:hypothetical protein